MNDFITFLCGWINFQENCKIKWTLFVSSIFIFTIIFSKFNYFQGSKMSTGKFGLTLRKKEEQQPVEQKPKAAVFNQDSDDEQEDQSAAAKFQRKYASLEKKFAFKILNYAF